VFVLLRCPAEHAFWRDIGVCPVPGDLDDPRSLSRLAGLADTVLHLAPPPGNRECFQDTRTRHLVSALSRGRSLPCRLIYVSTTGVYGDCGGAIMDETRPRRPRTARARRRMDAEERLRRWGSANRIAIVLLRAPGIYAANRLPRARLRAGAPALVAEEDVWSNHIHADDLAMACCLALFRGRAGRGYNVVDESDLRMGDYFDLVADHVRLPRPPRLPGKALFREISPLAASFMTESRRIDNGRMKRELRLRLRYPTVAACLASDASLSRGKASGHHEAPASGKAGMENDAPVHARND
jgi:nucleoside-diphosphate-sugar epimerase